VNTLNARLSLSMTMNGSPFLIARIERPVGDVLNIGPARARRETRRATA
jgi:hypothetical protein